MHQRIDEILLTLDSELAALRAAVDAVPAARHHDRPAPDRWSVADILEHLAVVETTIAKVCVRQLAAAREAGLGRETDSSSIVHTMPPARVADRSRRLTAPENLRPTGMPVDAAWAEIERVRERFRAFVVSCDGLALSDVSFPHPAFGPLNLYQWFLFAAGHHARHAAQIREIAGEEPRREGHGAHEGHEGPAGHERQAG